ncbi:hypothetical protein M0R45_017317 [Rubus argutus]|uniref:Uncharacterized protein n=1 Tax=Rubus argutus TaxID=59490 RepID=A0AAW1XVB7_RUBAR
MPLLDEKNIKGIGRERLKGGRCCRLGTPKCRQIGASSCYLLEQQPQLGFQVLEYLHYDSYVRMTGFGEFAL